MLPERVTLTGFQGVDGYWRQLSSLASMMNPEPSNLELLRQYVDDGGNKLLVINRGRSRKSISFTLSVFVVGKEREVTCIDRIVAPLLNSRLQRDQQLKHGIQYCVQSHNPAADLVHEVGKLLGTTPAFQIL